MFALASTGRQCPHGKEIHDSISQEKSDAMKLNTEANNRSKQNAPPNSDVPRPPLYQGLLIINLSMNLAFVAGGKHKFYMDVLPIHNWMFFFCLNTA